MFFYLQEMHLYCVSFGFKKLLVPDRSGAFEKLADGVWVCVNITALSSLKSLLSWRSYSVDREFWEELVWVGVKNSCWLLPYCRSWGFEVVILSPSAPKFNFNSNPQERLGLTCSVGSKNVGEWKSRCSIFQNME